MCKISYEKCVCFVFLVILAVLSCSGFRIDNLAMTDISKKNSHTSTSFLSTDGGVVATHRIRHHRQLRTPPVPAAATHADSPRRRGQNHCPKIGLAKKTTMSQIIVVARVESRSKHCTKHNCTIQFVTQGWLKNQSVFKDKRFKLKFLRSNNCEHGIWSTKSQALFRPKPTDNKYILFLNYGAPHDYSVAFVPVPFKKNVQKRILDIVKSKSNAPNVKLVTHSRVINSTALKLSCKVQGIAIPTIFWKRNNTILSSSQRFRITQKKMKSILLVRNPTEADFTSYKCVIRVNGTEISKELHPRVPFSGPRTPKTACREDMQSAFCDNGGTCNFVPQMGELFCVCPDGYSGRHCETKQSNQSSMYRQTLSTCKLGIFTKYDNC